MVENMWILNQNKDSLTNGDVSIFYAINGYGTRYHIYIKKNNEYSTIGVYDTQDKVKSAFDLLVKKIKL